MPIIALTASALKEDEDRCIAAGCDAFLGKPIRKTELLAKIEQVLGVSIPRHKAQPSPTEVEEADPELAALIPGFLDEVMKKQQAINAAASAGDFTLVAEIAHQLVGMGGSYGFQSISKSARLIERSAHDKDAEGVIQVAESMREYILKLKEKYE